MTAIEVDGLRWEVRTRGSGPPLLLVHGFTGRGTSWGAHVDALARSFRTIVVDLPGHGRTGTAEPWRMTVEHTATDLGLILERIAAAPWNVLGYSLGARVALALAVAQPEAIDRLVLESPSAGLATARERLDRREADEALARKLEADGIEAFVDAWERHPIFATQASLPAARRERLRAIRLANDPRGLAASLRGAGQGVMAPLFDRLPEISAPTLVLAGALDARGRPRAEKVARLLPNARLRVIGGAGHTPHEERPAEFRRQVLDFLQEAAAA